MNFNARNTKKRVTEEYSHWDKKKTSVLLFWFCFILTSGQSLLSAPNSRCLNLYQLTVLNEKSRDKRRITLVDAKSACIYWHERIIGRRGLRHRENVLEDNDVSITAWISAQIRARSLNSTPPLISNKERNDMWILPLFAFNLQTTETFQVRAI